VADEVVVDCEKCDKKWLCCRALRAEVRDGDDPTIRFESVLYERKGIKIVEHVNGRCVYLDPKTKKCKIWDTRPAGCREYDCRNDPKAAEIVDRDVLAPLDISDGVQVVVSLVVLEEDDERKISPMMVYSGSGPTACETFTISGTDKTAIRNQIARLIDKILTEGGA